MTNLASPTTSSAPKKRVQPFKGLAKSVGAFRKSKSKKSKRSSSKAASIAMEESKNRFLVEDSNSSITEDANLLDSETDSDYGLDLVVLLMHPISHRFELLQLEFDEADKAKISDLLAQIPLSVTENCLKDQIYDSILDQNSSDKGRPLILKSTKLVDAFGRKLSKTKAEDGSTTSSFKMVLVARPQGLSNADALKMAKPIFTNKDISSMLALSGFDVKAWKKKKFTPRSSLSLAKEFDSPADEFQNSSTSHTLLGLVFAIIIGMLVHSVMIKPTPTNSVLKPGSYLSKCGLPGFIPFKSGMASVAKNIFDKELFSCQDEFLRVNRDGTATLYDEDRQVVMVLRGGLCETSDCVKGLVMKGSDKSLVLGGKPVRQALVRKSHKTKKLLWPFEEEPKLKYKVASANAF